MITSGSYSISTNYRFSCSPFLSKLEKAERKIHEKMLRNCLSCDWATIWKRTTNINATNELRERKNKPHEELLQTFAVANMYNVWNRTEKEPTKIKPSNMSQHLFLLRWMTKNQRDKYGKTNHPTKTEQKTEQSIRCWRSFFTQ